MDSSRKIVRDPVYKQFKAVMKDMLLKQARWPAGGQIATERVLADEFKLSRVTISKALSELEAEGLIEKRPPGGTFVTDKVKSRGLVKFLFYLPDPLSNYPGYALVLSVLESKLAAQGLGLMFTSVVSDDLGQTRALVVVGAVGAAALTASIARTPAVTVDFGSFVEGVDGVELDNAAGAEKAVELLHKRGHRRIGYLGCHRQTESDEWPNSVARRGGYLAAMEKLRLEINPDWQRRSWAEPASSLQVAQELLTSAQAPTALVCFSDIQALGALEAARGIKLKKGKAFEAVCFSDTPNDNSAAGMAGYCVAPWRKIAEAAAELVLRRMENPQAKATHLVMTHELIEANNPA